MLMMTLRPSGRSRTLTMVTGEPSLNA